VTAITLVLGTLPMLAAGTPEFLPLLHVMTGTEWLITLVLAIGPSALSMVAWNVGAAGLGAEASGWFLYLLPVISVGAGAALLGEPLSLGELAGGALIMVSVFVSQRA
jgi:drug/metabolite transporter (DMT)-like permease